MLPMSSTFMKLVDITFPDKDAKIVVGCQVCLYIHTYTGCQVCLYMYA